MRRGLFVFEVIKSIHGAIRSESTWAFVLVIALVFSVIGGTIAWITDVSYKRATARVVSLDFQQAPLPVPFPPNSRIYYMELQESSRAGLASVSSDAAEAGSVWPKLHPDDPGAVAYRCTASNFGDEPIFALSISFKVTLLEANPAPPTNPIAIAPGQALSFVAGRQTIISGKELSSYQHTVEIPRLAPKVGEFTFYIYNGSPHFAQVAAPSGASYESGETRERKTLILKTTGELTFQRLIEPGVRQAIVKH